MQIKRRKSILNDMFGFRRKTYLDAEAEMRIVSAIHEAEMQSLAEIRVHLGSRIRKSVFDDAVAIFKKTGMHRTEFRNAVLIYVVPSEHQFAIIGDIGIHEKVHDSFWNAVRDTMQQYFTAGKLEEGIEKGVQLAGEKLAEYFPSQGHNPNEISNEISRG